MAKFKGLDQLSKKIKGLSSFIADLNEQVIRIEYDPHDPGSIDRAIVEAERVIDASASRFHGNNAIDIVAANAKEHYRQRILDLAAQKRLEQND